MKLILGSIVETMLKIAGTIALVLVLAIAYNFSTTEKVATNEQDYIDGEKVSQSNNTSNVKRAPAFATKPYERSSKGSEAYKPSASISTYDSANFNQVSNTSLDNQTASSGRGEIQNYSPPTYISQDNFNSSPQPINELAKPIVPEKESKKSDDFFSNDLLPSSISSTNNSAAKKVDENKPAFAIINQEPSSSSAQAENVCTPNVVGGAFGNPIAVTVQCNYPTSVIKYCLNKGTCCSPETSGTTYTTQVVVGPSNGSYCLSFYGNSDIGGDSVVNEQTYVINSTFPDLQVGHEKIFYQTTELLGTSFITSTDFGKPNYTIGQVNLITHDPGTTACEDIIGDYGTYTPTAIDILVGFDVSSAGPSTQVNIPLRLDQMDYGDNFITSYIKNTNYVSPLYSCATTKVTLDDFPYFQTDISQAEVGDPSVRNFEGQFTSYGFFETAIDDEMTRAPAGEDVEIKSGQNLKSGLFGIFY